MANVTTSAETNLVKAAQMARVREIDFTRRFEHDSLDQLNEVLGVTRKIPMMEGTTLYVYTTSGTLQNGAVPEGEIIPLSQYATTKSAFGSITLKKWRKGVSAEAIKKSGYEAAVTETDNKLLKDVQKTVRSDLFGVFATLSGSATTVTGIGLQEALANAWGELQVLFEDDTAEAVYFVNPLDIAEYLGKANITVQSVFGMNYIEDFLGLGTVIMSSYINQGTFAATAKENLILYYLTMDGDIAGAFGLTADETGYIGIKSGYPNEERAQIESLVMSGITYLVEYAAGVVLGTIQGVLPKFNVYSEAGSSSGKTKITTDYTLKTGESYYYTCTDFPIVLYKGQETSDFSSWNGSAEISPSGDNVVTIVAADNDGIQAAGYCFAVTAE